MRFLRKGKDPKITENQKLPDFQHFFALFLKFSVEFVDKNVENAQHGTISLSSRHCERDNCCFLYEKLSN